MNIGKYLLGFLILSQSICLSILDCHGLERNRLVLGIALSKEALPGKKPISSAMPLLSYLNEKLKLKTQFVVYPNMEDLTNALNVGEIDLASCTLSVLYKNKDEFIPIAQTREGRRVILITRKDFEKKTLGELRGKPFSFRPATLAIGMESTLEDRFIPYVMMMDLDIFPRPFTVQHAFSFEGTAMGVVEAVAEKRAILGAVTYPTEKMAVEKALERIIEQKSLNIVASSEPIPYGTFVMNRAFYEKNTKFACEVSDYLKDYGERVNVMAVYDYGEAGTIIDWTECTGLKATSDAHYKIIFEAFKMMEVGEPQWRMVPSDKQ